MLMQPRAPTAAAAAAGGQRVPIPPPRPKRHLNATSAPAAAAAAAADSTAAAAAAAGAMPPYRAAASATANSASCTPAAAAGSSSSAVPVRQPRLLFPCSWPQLPQSQIAGIPSLRSLAEWKKQLPQGKTGGLAKVAYFFCEAGSPRWTPVCTLTRDLVDRIGSEQLERALIERADEFGLTKEEDPEGEVGWTIKEQHARLFCVEFLHAHRDQLFEVVSGPTCALERLLDRLDDFDAWRDGHLKANSKPPHELTFVNFMQQHKEELEAKLQSHKHRRLAPAKLGGNGAELQSAAGALASSEAAMELQQEAESLLLFHFLATCSVVVVPKLSQLKSSCNPEKWCSRLLTLERRLQVLCFPPLQPQLQNVLKHREFEALTDPLLPRYVPLHARLGICQASVAAPSADVKPVASSVAGSGPSRKLWSGRVEYLHRPHNGVFPPTIVLPNSAQFVSLPEAEQLKCIQEMMGLLSEECDSGGWQVQRGQFVLKGSYAPHFRLISMCQTAKLMCEDIRYTVRQGLAQCPAGQSAFLLQPNLDGLAFRSALFFNRGKYLFHTLESRDNLPPTREQQAHMDDAPPPGAQILTSLMQRPQFHCQPQLVDFAVHALSLAESSSGLVSTAGMTRVDLGAEFVHLRGGQSEEQLIHIQSQPQQWHLTGAGFIVRPFLVKLHVSLDFALNSSYTSFDALSLTAETTAQQILALADEVQQRRATMADDANAGDDSAGIKQESASASSGASSAASQSSSSSSRLRQPPPPPPGAPSNSPLPVRQRCMPSKPAATAADLELAAFALARHLVQFAGELPTDPDSEDESEFAAMVAGDASLNHRATVELHAHASIPMECISPMRAMAEACRQDGGAIDGGGDYHSASATPAFVRSRG